MLPNIYIHEKLAHEHYQTLLREAEQERLVAEGQHSPDWLHRLAAKLGGYLKTVGTRLQPAQAVE